MTENTSSKKVDTFQKRKNKEEMKYQLITFGLMIIFTLVAFGLVVGELMPKMFVIPTILLLAIVQVAFQFYYFMHMKHSGHEMPSVMIYGGIWAAILTVTALSVLTWW
ncbi:cytochrome c oxidase subunit IVB [Virgibacillus phasianinus]|uniref:Cytochrome c oxidase subunit IVB n=1 Tax=Virgibacillus phasianinus TaxID=2017483 RepID=A0A220U6L2_9BACI|nr:cytochrome c oxidase subunit IVB [Virgibacillus phasianinus]ASK63612.1 cytochrome c oxidase subunit IVB [Virgibacillus phasianinus]